MLRISLTVTIVLVLCQSLSAATYYVSKSGSDSNNGTSWAMAWASTGKVNSSLSGGDTVFYGTGTFNGRLLPASGGSSNDRTVYACSSFVQGITTLTYTTTLTGWTQHSGNVYKTACDGADHEVWGDPNCSVVGQTDVTYDTILTPQSLLSGVDAAGEYFWNSGTDIIYVWRFGGGDPSSSTMQYSEGPVVEFRSGQDYVTIWGFNIKYGEAGGVYFHNAQSGGGHNYNHVEHCNFYWICGPDGVNVGGVMGNYGGAHDSTHSSHQTVVRACSTLFVTEWGSNGSHSSGVRFYSHWRTVVESCYVRADCISGDGINFKSEGRYAAIRYNYIRGGTDAGIHFQCYYHTDSIYGNVIDGSTGDSSGLGLGNDYWGIWLEGCEPDSNVHIYNNTIYRPYLDGIQTGSNEAMQAHGYLNYNVISGVRSGANVAFNSNDHLDYTVDSNLYYPNTVGFGVNGGVNWNTWRTTYGFDAHSTNDVDPSFANPATGDFSRPGASGEMNLIYGGRTWTVFGAVQPGNPPAPDTVDPVIGNVSTSNITNSTAVINWSTNEPANSQVEYGLDASYGSTTTLDPTLVYSHSVIVSGLDPSTTYHFRVISSDGAGNQSASSDYSFTTDASDITPPSRINDLSVLSSVNLAEGIPPTVSGSYEGFSPIVLTDGNLDPFGGTSTTWLSNESATSNHWVAIDFGQSVAVGRAVLYWTYNDDMSAWMTSQNYRIQSWNGTSWDLVASVIGSPSDSLTITDFPTVNTSRIRIRQPVNGGPQGYPTVIWMTELELFSGSSVGGGL